MGDFEGIWVFKVAGDGGGGKMWFVIFIFRVLVFKVA